MSPIPPPAREPVPAGERAGDTSPLRIALLTTGLRPVPLAFPGLPGMPVGIVEWDSIGSPTLTSRLRARPAIAATLARLRGRRHDSLRHLCHVHDLQFAAIDKRDDAGLRHTLEQWRIDLVITSGCAIVPVDAVTSCLAGAINLHPSSLPRWRGANPMFWQIATGEKRIGASVHRLATEVDRGHLLEQDDVSRPGGLTAAAIEHLLEGEIGVALLHRAIRALQADPKLPGMPQPADSPTPYARRVPLDRIGDELPLGTLSVDRAWDIMRFLGRCPPGWLEQAGIRSRRHWRPTSRRSIDGSDDDAWYARRTGSRLLLGRGAEAIECRAAWR